MQEYKQTDFIKHISNLSSKVSIFICGDFGKTLKDIADIESKSISDFSDENKIEYYRRIEGLLRKLEHSSKKIATAKKALKSAQREAILYNGEEENASF